MSEGKKYYCFCSSNCKYETMTKEQILTAIAQAAETGLVTDPNGGFITKVKEGNAGGYVTFWVGTQAQFNALKKRDSNCMYVITDSTKDADIAREINRKQYNLSWLSDNDVYGMWNGTYTGIEDENPYNKPDIVDQIIDEVTADTRAEVRKLQNNSAPVIINSATAEIVRLADSAEHRLRGLVLYGKSTQDGTPTPESPVEIVNAGEYGEIRVRTIGEQLVNCSDIRSRESTTIVDVANNGQTVKVIGTAAYASGIVNIDISMLSGKTIYLSAEVSGYDKAALSPYVIKTDGASTYVSPVNFRSGYTVAEDEVGIRLQLIANNTPKVLDTAVTATFTNVIMSLAKAAVWEPYKAPQTLAVDTPNDLLGIKVSSGGNYTDSTGQQWICDEIDFERGVYVHRHYRATEKDFSIITWSATGAIAFVAKNVPTPNPTYSAALCSISEAYAFHWIAGSQAHHFVQERNQLLVIVLPNTYTTVEQAQSVLEAGFEFVYPLAEPYETDLTEEELEQYYALHTNYPVTTILNDGGAGMKVSYMADTKNYIDKKFNELSTALLALGG